MGIVRAIVEGYSNSLERFSIGDKKAALRWVLNLPGAGCEYWKKGGGCTMCGFHAATNRFSKGRLLPKEIFKWLYIVAEKLYKDQDPSEIFVYNGGNFWNDREIPKKFQSWFFKRLSSHETIRRVMIENRCEYIVEEKIKKAVGLLENKRLYIGIGLESINDHIRNVVIKKGLSLDIFEEKVKLAQKNKAFIMAYIFMKPFGLSDDEALEDTIATIKYALSVGVSEIDVSCAFVQRHTELEKRYQAGEFTPPRLDTVVRLIEKIMENNWPVNIGGFDDYPPPISIPSNCSKCSDLFYRAIENFRRVRVLGYVPRCNCV
jgi:hypothetical protein